MKYAHAIRFTEKQLKRMNDPKYYFKPEITEWKCRVGDKIVKIVGDDIGKVGTVTFVDKRSKTLFAEGFDFDIMTKKDANGNQTATKRKSTLNYWEVELIDPSTGDACEVVFDKDENNRLVRRNAATGHQIPFPPVEFNYTLNDEDTDLKTANKRTYTQIEDVNNYDLLLSANSAHHNRWAKHILY